MLSATLLAIGAFFLIANVRLGLALWAARRLRPAALLTWPPPKPRYYLQSLVMALVLGLLVMVKLAVARRPPQDVFGEMMMLLYFGYLVPASLRVEHGFYEQGLWLDDDAFLPYAEIGGLSWREEPDIALLAVPRGREVARRLAVPREHYAEARRLLRDRMASHEIDVHEVLDLGVHDARDDV
jgi:hypothetical protein